MLESNKTDIQFTVEWFLAPFTLTQCTKLAVARSPNATCQLYGRLTLKRRETHRCVVSTVATDALVLKHQAISIYNAD